MYDLRGDARLDLLRHGATLLWGALILFLLLAPASSLPQVPARELLPGADKALHFALFLVFALLLRRSLASFPGLTRPWLAAVLVAGLFGGLTELLQGFLTSDRSAELTDLAADLLGAVCAGYRRS